MLRREHDDFDFVLAEKLGMTLGAVRALPNSEVVEWQARDLVAGMFRELRRGS